MQTVHYSPQIPPVVGQPLTVEQPRAMGFGINELRLQAGKGISIEVTPSGTIISATEKQNPSVIPQPMIAVVRGQNSDGSLEVEAYPYGLSAGDKTSLTVYCTNVVYGDMPVPKGAVVIIQPIAVDYSLTAITESV